MTATDRDAIADTLGRLPAAVIAALLSQVARCCPRCGGRMAIRTSWQTDCGRMAWLRCPVCGSTTKRKL